MRGWIVSQKGNAVFLILAICGVLAIFTGAVGLGAVNNMRGTSQSSMDDQARFIAAAGVQAALARLSEPRVWPSPATPNGQGDVWSIADYNYERDHLGLWSTTSPGLHADVSVYNNTPGAFHRSSTGPDGTAIPPGRILIISSGIFDDGRGARQSTTVAALAKPAGVVFDKAAFGADKVSILDSLVDCVDSGVAGWTPASYAPYDLTVDAVRGATVASNNNISDSIVFNGGSQVDGDVMSGPSSALGAIGYYGATITGVDGTLTSAKDTNTLIAPASATPLGGGGDVNYNAGVSTLSAGTYHISGDLNLSPGAELTLTGPTVIFVDGDLAVDGAILNMDRKPSDLQIFLTGGPSTVADFVGSQGSLLIAGADVEANISDSELFGAVLGNEVSIQNSSLHYDQAVATTQLGSSNWTTDSFINHATTRVATITPPSGGPPSDPLASTTGSGGSGSGSGTGSSTSSGTGSGSSGTGSTSGSGSGTSGTGGSSTSGTGTSGTTSTSGTGTSGTTSSSGGGTGGTGHKSLCCLDYSCGPPKCMIY